MGEDKREVGGSSPLKPIGHNQKHFARGGVAQLGEHLPCKQGVKSSNLSISMKIMKRVSEPG